MKKIRKEKKVKKILILTLIVSLGLLAGCGNNKENANEISYTNKYECSKSKNYTENKYNTLKENSFTINPGEEDTSAQAVESITSRIYDFNEDGSKVKSVYDVTKYKYLLDYDMEEEKAYFIKQCNSINKNNYKSCNVSLEDKTITITLEININSESNKEYYGNLTLDHIKESYASEGTYTCK